MDRGFHENPLGKFNKDPNLTPAQKAVADYKANYKSILKDYYKTGLAGRFGSSFVPDSWTNTGKCQLDIENNDEMLQDIIGPLSSSDLDKMKAEMMAEFFKEQAEAKKRDEDDMLNKAFGKDKEKEPEKTNDFEKEKEKTNELENNKELNEKQPELEENQNVNNGEKLNNEKENLEESKLNNDSKQNIDENLKEYERNQKEIFENSKNEINNYEENFNDKSNNLKESNNLDNKVKNIRNEESNMNLNFEPLDFNFAKNMGGNNNNVNKTQLILNELNKEKNSDHSYLNSQDLEMSNQMVYENQNQSEM